ncbi:MAG: CPBP family intramembrane metalloprotease [Corynebacterium sp.]|uniref:CPBP family intramembrane glutamic endopeptidase n=1 Tax=Corynebacterium sp. TaxID=1720 RepID=UPI0026E07FD3|nr:CPBP family intramembrane glutamic endopeptidase [Corynebacterium sp.]MDO5669987.1 CPBP family intramembrane metalloprotease [Corynebacterium sp.]
MNELVSFSLGIAPGMALIVLAYLLVRAVREPLLRIGILILGFILLRDAMTPAGLWSFGLVDGIVPWLRMTDNIVVLLGFGLGSLGIVALTLLDAPLRTLLPHGRPPLVALPWGMIGGVVAAAPVLALSTGTPLSERGGEVALSVLPFLLFMCLAGNLGEEFFFRGYLQGRLMQLTSGLRAALISAVLFAVCHSFLALNLTDVGWPLLAFTLWEGLICALLRWRVGLSAAVLAHGLAIFLLSAGLL